LIASLLGFALFRAGLLAALFFIDFFADFFLAAFFKADFLATAFFFLAVFLLANFLLIALVLRNAFFFLAVFFLDLRFAAITTSYTKIKQFRTCAATRHFHHLPRYVAVRRVRDRLYRESAGALQINSPHSLALHL